MKTKNLVACSLLMLVAIFSACRHEPDLSAVPEISYSQKIQPIIASNCSYSGCHDDGGRHVFSLVSYDDVIKNGDVKAGNPHSSKLYNVITNHGEKLMPPDAPLSSQDIESVYIWIAQGAKNN